MSKYIDASVHRTFKKYKSFKLFFIIKTTMITQTITDQYTYHFDP